MKEQFLNLPKELKEHGLFCCWQYEEQAQSGRKTKVPMNALTGQRAKSNDPQSFTSFRSAVESAEANKYSGIGIGIFNGIGAIDMDHCVDGNGTYDMAAWAIVELMHSYTEYSPSGDGLHILFQVDPDFQYDTKHYYIMNHKDGMEVYISGATNKYVTVTGNEIPQHHAFGNRTEELKILLEQCMRRPEVEEKNPAVNAKNAVNSLPEDQELLEIAKSSKNGAEFWNLWNGNWQGRYQSQSEADMALCSSLSFWTGADASRMDQLFRQSGLMRDKWNRRQSGTTYGAITIQKAIAMTTEIYTPKNRNQEQEKTKTEKRYDDKKESNQDHKTQEMHTMQTAFRPIKPLTPQQCSLPKFPVECLPKALREYVIAVAEHSQTSPDMAAVIGLGVLAVCLQGKYQIQGMPGYCEPLSLYTVVIASPGERKSSVMKDMTKYLSEYEQDYNEKHADEIRQNKQKREALERQIEGAKKSLENKSNEKLEEKLHQMEGELEELPELKPVRFFADDCSSEALTSLLANNNGVFSVISTEGGIFDIMAGRYNNKANIDVWLKGHCGDAIRVDRTGREPEYIPQPALSAILSIQPSVLAEIMENTTMTGRGLIARFLYASPVSRIGSRVFKTPPIAPEINEAYKHMIYQLMGQKMELKPRSLALTEEATDAIASYFDEHEKYLIGEGQGISDWASKYIGSILRIAGLIHLGNLDSNSLQVSKTEMNQAICIGKYFLEHSTYAYSMMGADLSIQKAKFVWEKIKRKEIREIKRSELFQLCRGKFFKKTAEIFPTLELLAENGYLRLEEQVKYTAGRPADVRVIVNPEAIAMSGKNE